MHGRAVSEANDQPISLKKIHYEPFKGRVLFHTKYSEYFKKNLHMFDALDFLAELTQHIPPKGLQLIRRYGLYASHTKGRWNEMPWVAERAPEGWRATDQRGVAAEDLGYEPLSDGDEEVTVDARERVWARLLAKVYEVDPMVCPKCGADMKCRDRSSDYVLRYDPDVIAVIEDPDELKRILRHPGCRAEQQPKAATRLIKIGRSPPGFDPDRLS